MIKQWINKESESDSIDEKIMINKKLTASKIFRAVSREIKHFI